MKMFVCILALLTAATLSACKGDPGDGGFLTEPSAMAPTGTIDGEFAVDAQGQGSLADIQVTIYASEEAFRLRVPAQTTRTGVSGRYVFTGLCCGNYYIDAWRDNDGDAKISCGDYYLASKDGSGMAYPCVVQEGVPVSFCGVLEVVR
jgi:uncharacterized protein (DUF2141 family)